MNLVLSSIPGLQAMLGVDHHRAAHGLVTAFLAGAALGQLATGPLADSFDRRAMLIAALTVFAAGSAAAGLAPTLPLVVAGRFLQGLGGAACLVLAEAIAARGASAVGLARRIGLINAGMALAIMLSPLVGAGIAAAAGWRGLFLVPAAAGLALLAWVIGLPRAAAGGSAVPRRFLDGTGRLLRSRRFMSGALAGGFVMANYFCLAAFGPHVAMTLHGLGHVAYGLLFAVLGVSYIAGNVASARLYARYGERRVVVIALSSATIAGAAGLALHGALGAPVFLAVGLASAAGTGLTLPSATSRALGAEAGTAGTAAGLFNFAIFAIGGLVTHIVADLLDHTASAALAALPAVTLVALVTVLAGYGRGRPD
jgi:DHA1 family bicyclomycin/chloramphenicol resistance-like MFS transporter